MITCMYCDDIGYIFDYNDKGKNMSKNMELKQIRRKIINMILPITGENILEMSVGFISMAMIGRLGSLEIDAIGISTRITSVVWAIFKGIATGAAVFVSQSYGAKDYKKLRSVIQQTLLSSIVLVILAQQIIFWNAETILKIFNPDAELMANAVVYLRTVSFGIPFFIIMIVVIGVLQGMGNAKTPFYIAFIMNIINVALSYMLIFGKINFPALGLKGAAIATVMAQIIGSLLGLYVLFNKNGVLNHVLNKKFFKLDLKENISIYKMGLPASMESLSWQVAAIILTRVMLKYGNTVLAAYQLGLQAESLSYMPAFAFQVAATTFIGQCIGEKDPMKGKVYLREIMKGSVILTSFSTILLVFFPRQVLLILTNEADVINLGIKYLIIMGCVQIPQNVSGVLNGALRGAGYTKIPMCVSLAGLWGIRIPFSLILAYIFKTSIILVWIIMGLDLVFRFILSSVFCKTKNIYKTSAVLKEI